MIGLLSAMTIDPSGGFPGAKGFWGPSDSGERESGGSWVDGLIDWLFDWIFSMLMVLMRAMR